MRGEAQLVENEEGFVKSENIASLGDSPMFWNMVSTTLARVDKLSNAGKAHAKELGAFYCSSKDKYSSITSNWNSLVKFMDEAGARNSADCVSIMGELSSLRIEMDLKMQTHVLSDLSAFTGEEAQEVHKYRTTYEELINPYLRDMKKFLSTRVDSTVQSAKEMEASLDAQRWALALKRVDLGTNIDVLDMNIHIRLLTCLQECLEVHWEFFRSGATLMESFVPEMEVLNQEIESLKEKVEDKKLRDSKTKILLSIRQGDELKRTAEGTSIGYGVRDLDFRAETTATSKEGYLYLLKTELGTKSKVQIKRAWCVVDGGKLALQRKNKSVRVIDLLLCTVKEARDFGLRYCFHIISPNDKCTLQATSNDDMNDWMSTIQNVISQSLNRQEIEASDPTTIAQKLADLQDLRSVKGNHVCADCGADHPDWISKNLAVLLCKSCSGVHRSLGTHISKVRSATLDSIDPGLQSLLKTIGNKTVNDILLLNVEYKLSPGTDREEIQKWIVHKYADKRWMPKPLSANLGLDLMSSVETLDYGAVFLLILQGADVNYNSPQHDSRTPLLEAVNQSDLALTMLFLEHGALLDSRDSRGWAALHYGVYRNHSTILQLLLRWNASMSVIDRWGYDPLSLAIKYESQDAMRIIQNAKSSQMNSSASTPWKPTGPVTSTFLQEPDSEDDDSYLKSEMFDQKEDRTMGDALDGLVRSKKKRFKRLFQKK